MRIPEDNSIRKFKKFCREGAELLACLTMYNEDFNQFSDSVGGFMRNYAELLKLNEKRYKGKVAIVCVADGLDRLDREFLEQSKAYGIFDENLMSEYFVNDQPKNEDGEFNKLKSIQDMKKLPDNEIHEYETLNIGHCFHSKLNFSQVLKKHKIEGTPANEWIVENLGFKAVPYIDFFFLIKHKNSGKIESHLWFFKGFCTFLNPSLT